MSLLGFETWRIILSSQGEIYGLWGENTAARMKCDIVIRSLGRLLDVEQSGFLMGASNLEPFWGIIMKCVCTRR